MDTPSVAASGAAPSAGEQSRRTLVFLYGGAVFLYWISLYLYVPTLPVYVEGKTDSLAMVGVVLSMYGLWQAIIRLPLGIAADWIGRRKPFIVVGLLLAGLGAWLMGASDAAGGVLVGRALTGLAAGSWVPLVVVFSTLFPPHEAVRASALLTLIGSVGRMIATSANGVLNNLGGYALAFNLAALAAVLAVVMVLPAREQRRAPRRPSVGGLVRLASRRDILTPSLLSALSQYVAWTVTFGFMPILAARLGADGIMQSMLVTLSIATLVVGNAVATSLVRRTGARTMVYISFSLLVLSTSITAAAWSLAMLFLAQAIIGLAQGIGYPVLMGMSIEQVDDEQRTTAMGLHQAIYAIGMFTGPWLSGILADAIGIRPMFAVTAVGCLVLGFSGARLLSKPERRMS